MDAVDELDELLLVREFFLEGFDVLLGHCPPRTLGWCKRF
jgi:hypothetical protein